MSGYSWINGYGSDKSTQEYVCPHCYKTVAGIKHDVVEFIGYFPTIGTRESDAYYILECPSCKLPTIYCIEEDTTYPPAKALKAVKHLSEKLEVIYNEVSTAIGAGCYTSAVILARTAIMHIAVEHDAEENKSFAYYVNYLVDKGYVPPTAKGWIDKIRLMANESVHNLEIWGRENAEMIGSFLYYLLVFVYELPESV